MTDFATSSVDSDRYYQTGIQSHLGYVIPVDQDFATVKQTPYTSIDKLAVYTTPPVSPPAHDSRLASRPFDQPYSFERGMDSDARYRQQYRTTDYQPSSGANGQRSFPYTDPSGFAAATSTHPIAQGGNMSYQQDYAGAQPRQQQQQGQGPAPFPPFSAPMVYPPSQATGASYQAMPQYQARPAPNVDAYGPSQYYAQAEAGQVVQGIPQQYIAAPMEGPTSFPQATLPARPQVASYNPAMGPFDTGATSAPPPPPGTEPQEVNRTFEEFQAGLRRIFEDIHHGRLEAAANALLSGSRWLGQAVVPTDDVNLYPARIQFWEQFNHCWLALGQKQKELTESFQRGTQPPRAPQPMSLELVRTLGNGVHTLCEELEPHGLVDYEMGVWEEEIVSILIQCLRLLENDEDDDEDSDEEEAPAPVASRPIATRS